VSGIVLSVAVGFLVAERGVHLFRVPVVGVFARGAVLALADFGAQFERTQRPVVEAAVIGVVQVEKPAEEGVNAAVRVDLVDFGSVEPSFPRDEGHFGHVGIDTCLVADHVGEFLPVREGRVFGLGGAAGVPEVCPQSGVPNRQAASRYKVVNNLFMRIFQSVCRSAGCFFP